MQGKSMILCCVLLVVVACDEPGDSAPSPVDVAGDWVFTIETTHVTPGCEYLGFLEGHWVITQDGHHLEFRREGTGEPRSGYIAGNQLSLWYRKDGSSFVNTESYHLEVSNDLMRMAGTVQCRGSSLGNSCTKDGDVSGTRGAPDPSDGASQGGACRIQVMSIEEDELRVLSDALIRTWG